MRARLRRKLAKKRAHEKLKQLMLLFHCDFEYYRRYGKPMLPIGFAWIKTSDGPDLIWKGER